MKKISLYLLTRILLLVSNILALIFIVFLLLEFSPIDPIQSYLGELGMTVSPEQRANIAESWGLNTPFLHRIFNWFKGLLQGDLGISYIHRQPVKDLIWTNFKSSFFILIISWLLSGVIGFITGVLAGYYKGTTFDKIVKLYCMVLNSSPVFWIGLLLMYLLSIELGWLPIALSTPIGVTSSEITLYQRIYHALLPIIVLTFTSMSELILYTREQVDTIKASEPVLFAQSRGASDKEIMKYHITRQTLIPAITIQFAKISSLFSGVVIIEEIFSYPGLGQLTVSAGLNGDLPLLLGIVFFSGIIVYISNTLADIINKRVDPRIRSKEGVKYV